MRGDKDPEALRLALTLGRQGIVSIQALVSRCAQLRETSLP